MKKAWVYILANKRNGTLYVGVTTNLPRRLHEHREGLIEGFTKRYGVKKLVWVEEHGSIASAIQREHNIKHWPRKWKLDLIEEQNSDWRDKYEDLI